MYKKLRLFFEFSIESMLKDNNDFEFFSLFFLFISYGYSYRPTTIVTNFPTLSKGMFKIPSILSLYTEFKIFYGFFYT